VSELAKSKARELSFVDRTFGFAVLQLIIQRLLANNHRLLQHGPGSGQLKGPGTIERRLASSPTESPDRASADARAPVTSVTVKIAT
jgi:hypothetical protein